MSSRQVGHHVAFGTSLGTPDEQVGPSEDDAEGVVEVVGHAGGHLTQGLDPFRENELLLGRLELFVGGLQLLQLGEGELFFVLILGIYETHELAVRASKELPAPLDVLQPWIRELGTLQLAMIRAA